MGSMKPKRPAGHISFESEMNIDWNGPVVLWPRQRAYWLGLWTENLAAKRIEISKLHGSSKFYTSQVVDSFASIFSKF